MKYIIIGLILIGIGTVSRFFPNIISGYSTLSQHERENSVKNGFPTFFSIMISLMGIVSILGYLMSIWLEDPSIAKNTVMISILVGALIILVIGNFLISKNQNN
ncbi:MAG TPA: DUF3784 domain-containing protein [Aequorivita sp.]|nr:DUF3784 domain-containing protein [Aequorivita sp.]